MALRSGSDMGRVGVEIIKYSAHVSNSQKKVKIGMKNL